MKGTVEKIWENESRSGQRYLGVSIDGQRYTLWDEKYFDLINEGEVIDFDWKKSGRYKNITEIAMKNDDNDYSNRRLKSIIRMSCLKSASELISDSDIETEKRADLAIDFAKKFENYIKEDWSVEREPERKNKSR
jgi:hypothetical protein